SLPSGRRSATCRDPRRRARPEQHALDPANTLGIGVASVRDAKVPTAMPGERQVDVAAHADIAEPLLELANARAVTDVEHAHVETARPCRGIRLERTAIQRRVVIERGRWIRRTVVAGHARTALDARGRR